MDISQITDDLYVGGQPSAHDVARLNEMGVRLVIAMRALRRPAEAFAEPPLQVLWLRTLDSPLTPIPTRTFVRGVEAALDVIRAGGHVFVHCKHGRHRSVAMAAAILIAQGTEIVAPEGVTLLSAAEPRQALALMAARFLYPARPAPRNWSFLVEVDRMATGESLPFRTPGGQVITVARTGQTGRAEDFVALSGTCPHLGCQVHWEAQNNRFFCPCHNGVFDASGRATAGPPAEARQSLGRFPLKIEGPMVFIELAEEGVMTRLDSAPAGPPGPGHDPCLYRSSRRRA